MTRDSGEKYIAAMARLSKAKVARDWESQQLRQRHAERVESADLIVARAEADVATARSRLSAAHELTDQTDHDAEATWYGVTSRIPARHAAQAGPLPEPVRVDLDADPTIGAAPATNVGILLGQSEECVTRLKNRDRPTGRHYLALAAIGAASAIAVYAAARGLIAIGQGTGAPTGVVISALGGIFAVLSPFVGVVWMPWYLGRQVTRNGPTAIAAVLAAGMCSTVLAVLLRPVTGV